MSVVLIGYRGSGKTTVGRLLAERLGKSFVDCDDLIVKQAGKSVREIFAEGGEETFRKLEASAVAKLAKRKDAVIALGGGAMMREENRRTMTDAEHQIVYLRCEPAELLRRIQTDPATSDNRPALTNLDGGIEEIQSLLSGREPIYKANMSVELDVTNLTPAQVVERLVKVI
jgi:shikimate kinase